MEIADWRERIDRINRELLDLLNRRTECAREIGEIKRSAGLPVRDAARERELLDALAGANGGPLPDASVKRIFRTIIDETVAYEESLRGAKGDAK
ncbi:MAG: chorismate mutase [Fibrobacterales bacterium]|nr:chorismate mutase [Fibrobacterales bacterium]MBP5187697.1 chorismate mutase [Fibrobacterales bacterium]MBP5350636.1 chorismate mutase [Fibrobacterales bacterium]